MGPRPDSLAMQAFNAKVLGSGSTLKRLGGGNDLQSQMLHVLGGSSHLGYVVNNHGDRKSPKQGCSPYKWPKWLINGGY